MIIFTDFDGTITKTDTLNMVLDEFTTEDWRKIEEQVTHHKLSEKEALQAEFDLLNVNFSKVISFLKNNAKIDPTFKNFVQWCKKRSIKLIVLSGGFDDFIQTVFNKFEIRDVPFSSNKVKETNGKWKVIQADSPKIKNLCNHCKTYHLLSARLKGQKIVYIGDGNTDRCPAEKADIIFAKDSLAQYLNTINRTYYEYDSFADIQEQLEKEFYNS